MQRTLQAHASRGNSSSYAVTFTFHNFVAANVQTSQRAAQPNVGPASQLRVLQDQSLQILCLIHQICQRLRNVSVDNTL